jgi:hypothetical protein
MADTIRQQIIDAIIATLGTISAGAVYQTSIGAVVKDFESNIQGTDREGELPVLSVYDLEEIAQEAQLDEKKTAQALTVQIRAFVRKETPSRELRKIIGDLQTAIGTNTRWNKLATGTLPVRAGMVVQSENFEIAAAAVEITVYYSTLTFNPYCQ